MENRILIIDGYIDTPACLGVPPYLSPVVRYIFGAIIKQIEQIPRYLTVDQFRNMIKAIKSTVFPSNKINPSEKRQYDFEFTKIVQKTFQNVRAVIIISGVSVPGKYLTGYPIKYSELKRIKDYFPESIKILCGPATQYGIGEEGGKPSKPVEGLINNFDYIIKGDAEIAFLTKIQTLFTKNRSTTYGSDVFINSIRKDISEIDEISILGASLITQHPNYNESNKGNLICEIETFTGCPRYKTGGCAFCIEPLKGKTQHRSVNSVINEVYALYEKGVRHFRIGNQSDFYAFHHKGWVNERYPQPNPIKIYDLLHGIRDRCKDLKTLHIDNVNPLNFVLYPKEAELITQYIVNYCTAGNIAAFGVESLDPHVISQNNLKVNENELMKAIITINKIGGSFGENGSPQFLPGLNFIMGLPGETEKSLEINHRFLEKILYKVTI